MSSHYVSVLLTFLRKKSLSVWYMSFPFQSKLSSSLLSVREMCIPKTGVSSPTCLPAPFLFRPLRWFHDCPFGYLLVCRKFEQFLLESSDLMFSTFLRQTNFLFIFVSVSRIFSVFLAILVVILLTLGQRLASRNTAAIVHTLFPPWADRSFEWRLLANRRAR